MKSVILLSSTAAMLGFAVPAHAELGADDAIVITAGRSEQPLSQVGLSVTVIGADEIARRQSDTVLDLLRSVPGLTSYRSGNIGNTASVFIRGASSDHTAALIDGIKLNDPSTPAGGFDFGRLLTGNIERIEVVRGSQSVLWGSQAIGGVVNMITREPTDDLSANAHAEYGYRDTMEIVSNVSGKAGPISASIGGGYFRTDGISSFSEARGGTEKDGFKQYAANAKVKVELSEMISVDLRGWYADSTVRTDGYPAPNYVFADDKSYAKATEFVGYAGVNLALLDGRFHNRFAVAYTNIGRDGFDPAAVPQHQYDSRGRNMRLEYQGIIDVNDVLSATFGAETEKSKFSNESDYGFGASVDSGDARLSSFYGQVIVTPVKGLTVTGGARHDHHSDFGNKTTFATNAVYTLPNGTTTFRASYGEGFKAPSLYQLFGAYGNKLLNPENSKSWDAGITQKALDGAVQASATYFHRNTRNLIDFISCGSSTGICTNRPFGTYDNVGRAKAEGVEFSLLVQPVTPLTVQWNYSFVKSTDAATRLDLLRRPRHSANMEIDYQWPFALKTGASITHRGASFDINGFGSRVRVADHVLVDLRAAYPVTKQIEVYGRIENLFKEGYETVYQYGSAGRAAYAGVRLTY